MKWKLHGLVDPFTNVMKNTSFMSDLSKWRSKNPVSGYNDWYQSEWDHNKRYNLYDALLASEKLDTSAIDYLEFGVSGGNSFKWWLEHNKNPNSSFHGFDTFEGLPENWGHFDKGAMAVALESLNITDSRAHFYKGLFQDTLIPFLNEYKNERRKLIHMDADLFSSTIFSLSQLYRFLKEGDIILFDEFAVPKHEFAGV
jgi:hypothetical protein